MHRYISSLWKKPRESLGEIWRSRLIEWRAQSTVMKIERPTRPDRARQLGYRAKEGFVIARVKVPKGNRKTPKRSGGRTPKASGRFFSLGKSKQVVAEEKAARRFPNLEVLNSYWVGEDGVSKWYEVILLDPNHPSIRSDKDRKWISGRKHRGRVFRGKTSAGRKSRGLRNKGIGAEKIRPSLRANKGRGK